MRDGDIDPQIIVEEKGLKQESDPKALEALIDKIINDNREKAIEYKNGKEKLFGFFVGQAMKASSGKARAIESALRPVKVPISRTFLILEILMIKCKK